MLVRKKGDDNKLYLNVTNSKLKHSSAAPPGVWRPAFSFFMLKNKVAHEPNTSLKIIRN